MIAVDTNILVYAHRSDSPDHDVARRAVSGLVEAGRPWGIPWPCVHEFYSVVTHPRVFVEPTSPGGAVSAIAELVAQPGARTIGETHDHLALLHSLVSSAGIVGPRVHDARIAAICLGHGVDELWTADRDFGRFPTLRTRNPLVVP